MKALVSTSGVMLPKERRTMADLLIVDDDLDASGILADVLRAEGHEVHVAHDGKEGLDALTLKRPALVLLDVEMPVLTGPEVAYRAFLHDAGLELIPIVLCSGIMRLSDVASLVGTPYFLGKPFTLESMLALVDRGLTERAPPGPNLFEGP
jgi:CheY-like chemotaxis protein